jgi:hypothetical protein
MSNRRISGVVNRIYLIVLLLATTLTQSCHLANRPPVFVWSRGATRVVPGRVYDFAVVAEDPDSDSLQCEMTWGDGTEPDTSSWLVGSDTFRFAHSWADTGVFVVRLRIRDAQGAEAPVRVFAHVLCRIEWPPAAPEVDSFWTPPRGFTGERYRLAVRAQDINGDRVRYQYRWGEGDLSDWSPWKRSGVVYRSSHAWSNTGAHGIAVRCEDRTGLETSWIPVGTMMVVARPELRWEVSLDEPGFRVPLVARSGEVVVADRDMVARYDRATGEWLGEHLGPVGVRAFAGSADAGVFVRDADAVWGYPESGRWRTVIEGTELRMVLRGDVLAVATRDTCWMLSPGTGMVVDTIAGPALNWIAPVQDANGDLLCLGDSLRRFDDGNRQVGVWSAPGLVPDVVVAGPRVYHGWSSVGVEQTLVQAFDTAGTAWYHLLGAAPNPVGPHTVVVGPGGCVYVACRDSVLAFEADGRSSWAWAAPAGEAVSCGTPCLGSAGSVFVGLTSVEGGALVALDSTGREGWRIGLDCHAPEGMVLGQDSVVYGVGADDPTLFAVYVAEAPAPDPCWPMYGHDAGQTGRVWGP